MKLYAKLFTLTIVSSFLLFACTDSAKTKIKNGELVWKTAESAGFEYNYIENDPSETRFYTLENGLTVILSPSNKEPRIQTFIAIKAGSKTDPATHTGLAHYLEHMLFKGTDKYGSLDWEKEKPLLDKIESLYEEYNSTTDESERKLIYQEIDRVSGQAAKYAIANEYDKIMSGMGAQGTNAFTSVEQTVYTEDIPSNVVDKFLTVQAERFRNPVLRLFHTELEAVYEEKNRSLDSDGSKVFEEMFAQLFPNNNYGKQTTIGTIEHLKNPSLVEIRKYYENYYVPNNMAIIMAGDFNPDDVIKSVAEKFAYMQYKDVPVYEVGLEKEITSPIQSEVYGPEPERLMFGYRFPGASSEDAKMLELVGEILTNGAAGLIDLNLVQKQKLLGAYAFPYVLKDYSVLLLGGNPLEGQSLDEVKALLLGEIDKLKSGDFSEDIITSIINNAKKGMLETNENYTSRAYELMDNFVLGTDWKDRLSQVKYLNKISKQDVVDFANKYFKDNYVAVYKLQGEDDNVQKVEKPAITPVEVNREAQSDFLIKIAEMPENEITPLWLDFEEDIQRIEEDDFYPVLAVQNNDTELFELKYYFETGKWSNPMLSYATGYLNYIGTDTRTAEDISKEFYKLATDFQIWVNDEDMSIRIMGLQENFEASVRLFDELLKNCVADEEALLSYIDRVKKSRQNAKENKGAIMSGLRSYAMYGAKNPFNSVLSNEELDNLTAEVLTQQIHTIANYKHSILYYGPKTADEITEIMKTVHPMPETFAEMPEATKFEQNVQTSNSVLLAHYDMVQAEIFWVRNSDFYNEANVPTVSLFNQYFGGGMESIVFQTIRESKALAYSTYARFNNPSRKDRRTSFFAYVGTQADKFSEAVDGMNELLTELPKSDKAVENAKRNQIKTIASERIIGMDILNSYLSAKRMGRDYDIRKHIYNKTGDFMFEDLQTFHKNEISGKPYTYCIVADEGKLNSSKLKALGTVKTLKLEEIFGY